MAACKADLCKPRQTNPKMEKHLVYSIPCRSCDKVYIGETHRGLDVRIKEHKADIRYGRCCTGLSDHILTEGHSVDWEGASILKTGLDKRQRKFVESIYITAKNTMNVNSANDVSRLMCDLLI